MAFIDCWYCHKKYSDNAPLCPFCKTQKKAPDKLDLATAAPKLESENGTSNEAATATQVNHSNNGNGGPREKTGLDQELTGKQLSLFAIGLVAAGFFFYFIVGDGDLYFLSPEPEYRIDSSSIYWEFQKNELAATSKYDGKRVAVTGLYVANGSSFGDPWILIGPGFVVSDVQCFLRKNQVEKAGQLRKNQKITVEGTVGGKLGSVILRRCEITSP